MLELGRANAGTGKGGLPVVQNGAVVASLHASNWKEAATAVVGDRRWVFAKSRGELTGRWEADPADAVRLRASQVSFWRSTWAVDLEGTAVQVQNASLWRGTHRYLVDGRVIAESGTTGTWSPRPTLDAETSVPLDHQVFLLWLELVLSRRNAAVTAGTTAAIVGGTS
jgi:hypothetical protein